jgi:hypothetical protein
MYNCVIVRINNRPVAIFHTMNAADNFRNITHEKYAHLNLQINCDWAYIPDLPF